MKARTKLQLRVAKLSNELPRITPIQEQWAFRECLPHLGFANKTSAFCLDCGNTFSRDLIQRKRAVCPHCETKLTITFTQARTHKTVNYFAITHIVEDFQVVEHFEINANYKKGVPVRHQLSAILEDWILPDGKVTQIGRQHNLNWGVDSWSGNWEIRTSPRSYYSGDKYDIYPRKYHPDSKLKPEYKRLGMHSKMEGITILEAVKFLPNHPIAETLLKAKHYSLLGEYIKRPGIVSRYWSSIKICIRNKYKTDDPTMWIDYLDLLQYFGKDLRNAKYVCPGKLKKEHDRLMNKKKIIQKKQEIERRRKEIAEAEADFAERIKAFAGLQFSNGSIVVKVLETVKEFEIEGDLLNHCLFISDYYSKPDSLILSARIDDTPIETVEVSLSKLKIIQCRGYGNKPTEYNKKIVALVKKNLNKIKELKNNFHLQKQIS